MKKIIAFGSMVVALGFVAAGCGGGSGSTPAPTPAVVDVEDAVVDGDAPAEEVGEGTQE